MQRLTTGFLAVALVLAVLFTVQLAGSIGPAPESNRERFFQAWSDSLTRQAERYEANRAQAERMQTAWSDRLGGLAEHQLAQQGISERAKQAWSDRLTGLARHLGAID